jgi:hypothetical protein
MKKWMFVAVVAGVALVAAISLVPMALAQGPADGYGRGAMVGEGQFGPGFVDEDGNGTCDNFVDTDGDGVCDLAGTGLRQGRGFVDEDGNGTCDNFVDADGDGVCDHAGEGGQGPGFVDEDGDGVCDHAGAGRQAGHGGRMMGRRAQ